MAIEEDIDTFHEGEGLALTLAAKNRDGSVITTPASQTITFEIATKKGGPASLTFNSSPQVVLTDSGTGTWTIAPTASDLSTMTEGKTYYYNIRSQLGAADPILQKKGKLVIQPGI